MLIFTKPFVPLLFALVAAFGAPTISVVRALDCCGPGASCCVPGAPCCAGHKH
jgi:hypothetical protein